MSPLSNEIERLKDRISKLESDLVEFYEGVKNLKNKHSSEIQTTEKELSAKQKELGEVYQNLAICQQEKERILKNLNTEIEKVKNSNLSNEEKSKQIIALTVNNQKQFTETSQYLSNAWQSYHQIQQKIIEALEKKNQDEFKKAIVKSDQTNQRNSIIKITLLAIIIIFLLIPYLKKSKKLTKKLDKSE